MARKQVGTPPAPGGLDAATMQALAAAIAAIPGGGGGGTAIHVGPTPPPSPADGQLWVQTI